MALNKRERVLLFVTIGVIAVGGNFLLLSPLKRRWDAVNSGLRTQRRELASMKATIQRAPEWRRNYDELRQGLGQRTERFEQISDVLKKIDGVAGNSGILMQTKQSLAVVDKGVYREWPVKCRFEATIESLQKFLCGLQTSSGLMSVEQFQVTARADNPSILRCDIQIKALAGKSEGPAS